MLDEALIESVRNGNRYAFKTLFNIYENRVFRTAYLILRDRQYAEDVVQETFLQVYLKINNLKSIEAFDVWLYKITVNQCTNYQNKTKNVYSIEMDDTLEKNIIHPLKDTYDTENRLIEKETRQGIIHCMYSLPLKYRTVLTLFYYNELSIYEIAQIANCTEGTVKSRLFYGKKKLKKVLINSGFQVNDMEEEADYEVQ